MNESARSSRISACLRIREQHWIWGERTHIMGIVNVTPDSFSGDGLINHNEASAYAAKQIAAGSDIIDIGGESTRPGFNAVTDDDEMARVLPVIRQVRATSSTPISIDTTKPSVLVAALDLGADILNCIQGLPLDLLPVVAERSIPIIISHWREKPVYQGDVMSTVIAELSQCVDTALQHHVAQHNIILDPGIGFGKTAEHNLQVLQNLNKLKALGFPILIGTSRKSFIGKVTGHPPSQRVFGTAATVALAIAAGVDIVRVHDVAEMKETVMVADAISRAWRPAGWQHV